MPIRAINLENSIPPKIALIDYGSGNIRSVAKALERSGARVEIASRDEGAKMAKAYTPEDLAFRTFAITMAGIGLFIGVVIVFIL